MRPKILIAEDDDSLRKLYETVLTSRGYRVSLASNGEEALKLADSARPDIILLDVMMPEIHGLNVLEILKADPKLKHIKVIMITALDDQATKKRALKSGAADYIVKSQTNITEVIKRVSEALN